MIWRYPWNVVILAGAFLALMFLVVAIDSREFWYARPFSRIKQRLVHAVASVGGSLISWAKLRQIGGGR